MTAKGFPNNTTIANIAGIPVRIHWTFLVFLLWVGFGDAGGLKNGLLEVFFVISIFICVVLHEFGHALTAKFFGIRTRDITLYPIGGVAMLDRNAPSKQEFFIALNGPLVNVLICVFLYPFLSSFGDTVEILPLQNGIITFWDRLFLVNVILVIFNMIPAYPMDGGRIVKSILGVLFGEDIAIKFSSRLGQIVSLLMAAYAIYTANPFLLFISIFIFMQASNELKYNKLKVD